MQKAMSESPGLRIGTSGWAGNGWRKLFYPPELPERDWLAHYARHFSVVELTATCYRLPEEDMFLRWREMVPDDFVFAVRAPHRICRRKRLRNCDAELASFLKRIALLDDRLGPVVWQLPPTFRRDGEALEDFLPRLPGEMTHVFEFRHASWHAAEVRHLLARHGVTMAFHDHGGRGTPWWITGSVVFFRLNGVQAQKRCYGFPGLEPFVDGMEKALESEGRPVFAVFGDDAEGCAVRDASVLQHLFGQRPAMPDLIAQAERERVPVPIVVSGEDRVGDPDVA